MLTSDYRIRTQPESQVVDGSNSYSHTKPTAHPHSHHQQLPQRSTPNSLGTSSISMYGRGGGGGGGGGNDPSGRYLQYAGLPPSSSNSSAGGTGGPQYIRSSPDDRIPPNRQRMSLLHPPPQSLDYVVHLHQQRQHDRPPLQQQGSLYANDVNNMVKMHPINESPPCKKLKLQDSKPELHSPLKIDTDKARSGSVYNPQVENISPTLPSDPLRDESTMKNAKTELLEKIGVIDREIAKTESSIAKLKRKKIELEEAATRPKLEPEEPAAEPIIRSLPQRVYAENRKKAAESHQVLDKLGPRVDLPLYNQPSDTAVYKENKIKFAMFKGPLQNFLKTKVNGQQQQWETHLSENYARLSADFTKRLDKMENNNKRKAKDAKNREVFEKIFPELRKQREDKERFSRVGSRIKSDADLEEIMDGLHEQEMEDKKMRSYAVIPPILLDERSRKRRFRNTNGLIEDPMQEYKDKQLINLWTDSEKEIFKEKFLQHPKNFGIIKQNLERKSIADCVQYYYLSKKSQNYRQLLRKNRARTRSSRNQQQNNNSNSNNTNATTSNHNNAGTSNSASTLPVTASSIKNEANGVTTRLQKEQKVDPTPTPPGGNGAVNAPIPEESNQSEVGVGEPTFEQEESSMQETPMEVVTTPPPQQQSLPQLPSLPSETYMGQPKKKRKEGIPANNLDTSEEENADINGDKIGPHNCIICKLKIETQSRPFVRSQAAQYGISEDDVHPGDRICNTCRCKVVRRRYRPVQCPIPTCPTKKSRHKRLRPFPPKWTEISDETRQAICEKYQIAENVTKCCSACFNRINRRLSPNANLDAPDENDATETTRWVDDDIDKFRKSLVEYGTDWRQISEQIPTKSHQQCKKFFYNFRKKYGLDLILQEYRKSKGCDGPPILTSEEESGSTTSSCDEGVNHSQDHQRNPLDKKDDYDTSATVSAEEGGSVDTEKPQSIETMKTLPNNPDSPLQLTLRTSGMVNQIHQLANQNQSQQPQQVQTLIRHPQAPQLQHQLHHNTTSITPVPSHPQAHQSIVPHSSHGSTSILNRESSPHHSMPPFHGGNSVQSQLHIVHGPVTLQSSGHQQMQSHHNSNHPSMRHAGQENNEPQEPMTVKDLIMANIELQLRRNPSNNQPNHNQVMPHNLVQPGQSISPTPTIQSILKSQDRTHLPPQNQQSHIVISSSQPPPQHIVQPPNPQNASMGMGPSPYQSHPLYYGSRNIPPQHMIHREQPNMSHMQQVPQPRDEYETLDLSMKKRTPSPHVSSQRPPSSGPPPAHQPLDFATRQDAYYPKYQMNRMRQTQPVNQVKPSPKVPPPPLLTTTKPPSISPMKDGSITHGTPLNITPQQQMSAKYEGLLRPLKEGSITQGTPVDKIRSKEQPGNPYMYERNPEYFKRMSPASYNYHAGGHAQVYNQRPPSSGQRSPPTPGGQHPSPYPQDQHNTSRQIIMSDYYTSQQMQQPPLHMQPPGPKQPRLDLTINKRVIPQNAQMAPGQSGPVYLLQSRNEPSYRQCPTPPSQQPPGMQQQRQGVIHRVTPHRPAPKPDPGRYQQHDAFASFIDIAAAQPSLPVPKEDPRPKLSSLPRVDVKEGLGRSMMEIERNRMIPQPHHHQPQVYRSSAPSVPHNQIVHDPTRLPSRKEVDMRIGRETQDATLTAASLIDAIITHQINQPSPHDRQSPIPTSRTGDRLFASFQRSVQAPVNVSHPGSQPNNMSLSGAHLEELRKEELRAAEKTAHGGTWGDHIDFIISKDYASGKGSMPAFQQHVAPPQQQLPPGALHLPKQNKPDEGSSYVSWKLRRALQHEKEQMQSSISHPHPDEKHIIRVVQLDQQQQHSRPPSAKEGPISFGAGEESGDLKDASSSSGAHKNKSKEGIYDYVANRIVEVMRTQNNDDKPNEDTNTSLDVANSTSKLPPINSSTAGTLNLSQSFSKDQHPRQDHPGKDEPGKEEVEKQHEVDSPTPMVIDESVGGEEKERPSPSAEPSSKTNSNPNYEPLTDEEN